MCELFPSNVRIELSSFSLCASGNQYAVCFRRGTFRNKKAKQASASGVIQENFGL